MAQTNVQAFSGDVEISSNLAVNTNDLFVDTESGRVGIGVTDPGYKLQVSDTVYINKTLAPGTISTDVTRGDSKLLLYDISADNWSGIGNDGGGRFWLTTGTVGTRHLFVMDSSGNVGIGVTNPDKKLTVAGNMELGTGSGSYQHLRVGGGNSSGFLYGAFAKYSDGIHMGYNFYNDNSSNQIPNAAGGTSRITMQYGQIQLHTGGVNTEPNNNALCITSSGNVGIGVTNPATPFHINKLTATINPKAHTTTEFIRLRGDKVIGETYAISGGIKLGGDTGGTATADGRIEFYANDGANAGNSYGDIPDNFVMCIRGDGRVGIGVTDPSDSLHVSGQISTQNGGGKTPAVLFRSGANNTNSWEVKANVSDSFAGDFTIDRLDAATKQKFIIKNNGNVGIGTASPRGGLEVVKASTSTNPITSTHGLTITNNQTYSIFGGLNYHTGITFRGYGFVSNISDLGKIVVQKINSANLGDSDMIFYTNYESDRGNGGPGDLYERMRIASAGNVGIGTNGPGHKLHVSGNVFGSGFFNHRQSFYMTPNITYTVFTASSGMQGYVFLIGESQIQASMRISWRSGWTSFYYSSVYAAGLNTWAVNGSNIWARHAQSGSKTAWCRVLTVGTV
jgi:hypothetical protein